MASFTDVVTGNQTLSANVNQLVDALNGTVSSQIDIVSPNNTSFAILAELATAPTLDQTVVGAQVNADTKSRAGFYIRGTGGYGGIFGGVGGATNPSAHMYAGASGWNIPEALAVTGALSGGAGTLSSLTVTGVSSLDNGAITTNGSGAMTASAFHGPADSANAVAGANVSGTVANATIASKIVKSTSLTTGDTWGFPTDSVSGKTLRGAIKFSGTGSGTYSFTMLDSVNPNFVAITSNQTNSSQTVGVDSLSSTSCHVNLPNSWPFYGFVTAT